jgi:hypothetical protein
MRLKLLAGRDAVKKMPGPGAGLAKAAHLVYSGPGFTPGF